MFKSLSLIAPVALLIGLTSVLAQRGSKEAATEKEKSAGEPSLKTDRVCLRIQLGLKDAQETVWDGSLEVDGGTLAKLDFWRKGLPDRIEGNTWKLSSRPAPRFNPARNKQLPMNETGLIVTLDGAQETALVKVATKQGDFQFQLAEVPYGKRLLRLEGAADVVRIPASYQLTAAATEEDYPSAALAADGTVWVAYVAFTHGQDFAKRLVFPPDQEPDISKLDQPTGGDRVFALSIKDGRWSEPLPVTKGGEDLYKTAIAVDGRSRPWVFWSGNVDGNFDLYAACLQNGKWTAPLRLTKDPGPDLNPAAAADAQGHVWVTWQGFRGNNSNILAARQQGETFSEEIAVSSDPGNEWDPAIATAPGGEVAIAWDSYGRGNYDVLYSVASGGKPFGAAVPVAATLRQEAHASCAYDAGGRLWIAWEEGPENWGKDFGALDKAGAPLYGGGPRSVAVKCYQGGRELRTSGELNLAVAGGGGGKAGKAKPKAAAKRTAGQERATQAGVPNSLPRLAADTAGRVWLAYRSRAPHFWCSVGTSWFEYLTCYQGNRWTNPIYVHNSSNILDNRPVLVSLSDGRMLLVGSSDGRQMVSGYQQAQQRETPQGGKAEPVNNDIFVSVFGLGSAAADPPQLAAAEPAAPAEPVGGAEKEAVARCQNYRLEIGGKSLQLMRGEFHRHTELSSDGGGDGTLIDMYRYALDAVGFDWIGNGDHDNNNNREYPWWITQKTADAYKVGDRFVPMFSYERSVSYPDGHRNPIFARRGIRTLPRFGKPGTGRDDQQPANTPDTQLLYKYLRQYDGVCASHTSATDMGTDWRDNDPVVEPVVEIYQGCRQNYEEPGAPRAPSVDDAIGGWRPNGFVWRALEKGYRLGFQSSSDHVSTHISYCNAWVEDRSRQAIFDALKQRHVYGATDNIIADVRCGAHLMGDEFRLSSAPALKIKLIGTANFKSIDIVKNNAYVYTSAPGKQEVEFTWTDMEPKPGKSYYYVRGQQEDGEMVWVSPMWIQYQP